MEILNVTASELRDITTVASQEEQVVFLGFFINLMRRFGINDPSNPEILKYGLQVLENFARPKMELPIVSFEGIYLWVGIHNNRQLICNALDDGLILSEVRIDKKIKPTVMTVQYNIAAPELYPAYLEAYLKSKSPIVEPEPVIETTVEPDMGSVTIMEPVDDFVPPNQA